VWSWEDGIAAKVTVDCQPGFRVAGTVGTGRIQNAPDVMSFRIFDVIQFKVLDIFIDFLGTWRRRLAASCGQKARCDDFRYAVAAAGRQSACERGGFDNFIRLRSLLARNFHVTIYIRIRS
jgi:hypothetical protein